MDAEKRLPPLHHQKLHKHPQIPRPTQQPPQPRISQTTLSPQPRLRKPQTTIEYQNKSYIALSNVSNGLTKDQLLDAMNKHVVEQARIVGTYER
jgi:hypothetical protein